MYATVSLISVCFGKEFGGEKYIWNEWGFFSAVFCPVLTHFPATVMKRNIFQVGKSP